MEGRKFTHRVSIARTGRPKDIFVIERYKNASLTFENNGVDFKN